MPAERRRQPVPDPSEFPNPRAEKTYWATERLLDEAPSIGKLQMRYLYDSWHNLREEFLLVGESDDDARQIAWGAVIFFGLERTGDIFWELKSGKISEEDIPMTEVGILGAWNIMSELHSDKERDDTFIGEPFFSVRKENRMDLNLHDHEPIEIIDPDNPDSPKYGHIQLLDKMADKEFIPEELKKAVLQTTEKETNFLEHEIDSWNKLLTETLPERVDEEARDHLLETTYGVLTITMVNSWGDEKNLNRRLELLDIYLSHFRQKPNPFQSFLSIDGFDLKIKEWEKNRGGGLTKEEREYHVPSSVLSEIKFKSLPELSDINKPVSYAIELDEYRELNFGLIVTWVPELQLWLGHGIVSFEGKEPPRSILPPIRLLDVKSPAEALTGLIQYYQENLEAFRPPKKVLLKEEEKNEALKRLSLSEIKRVNMYDTDQESETKAFESAKSLLKEIGDFRKFPPIFCIAVQNLQTKDIHWGLLAIKNGNIMAPGKLNNKEAEEDFIRQVLDFMVTKVTIQEKVLVCSDSIYQLIIKDPKTKIRSTIGRKSIIKRPGGLIIIYRGQTLQ